MISIVDLSRSVLSAARGNRVVIRLTTMMTKRPELQFFSGNNEVDSKCRGQGFDSPQLHQEVLVSGGGSQGYEISRIYKALARSSAVCDGHLTGLSASRGWTRRRVSGRKIPFPKSALVGLAKQRASET
jgi:hypothetical protein